MRNSKLGKYFLLFLFTVYIFIIFLQNGWDGKSRFTLVMQNIADNNDTEAYDLAVFSVEPNESRGNFLMVSSQFMLDIPYGYKMYPVYSVYKLGELDEKLSGGTLLKKSIEATFGIKTDRYLLIKNKSIFRFPDNGDKFREFKKNNFSLISGMDFLRLMFISSDTDLKFAEKIKFFLSVRRLKSADFEYINIENTRASKKVKIPDNSEVSTLDTEVFDQMNQTSFQDIRVRREGYTIEVQNASGKEKIAGQFSRILERMGANVIFITTAEKESAEACLLNFHSEDSRKSVIASILKKIYLCHEDEKNKSATSDIKVIIGRNFLK